MDLDILLEIYWDTLQYELDEYGDFALDKNGEYIKRDKPEQATITGLALAAGLDRKKLIEYGKRDEFSNIIKRHKGKVEAIIERLALNKGGAGPIFVLKNMGWSDKLEVEASVSIEDQLRDLK
jgi:hypothetical protein